MPDHLEVAAKEGMVANVEADDGDVEADICFGQVSAEDELCPAVSCP